MATKRGAHEEPQLGLFAPETTAAVSPALATEDVELARVLPKDILFGTSTWTFPGWKDIVYRGHVTTQTLLVGEAGLRAYAAHPLFGTVGIDRSYYNPLTQAELEAYAAALPPGFPCVVKVWSELVSLVLRGTTERNPRFLDVELARETLLPLVSAFRDHVGALLVPFPPLPLAVLSPDRFATRLDAFLGTLDLPLPIAVEVRNRELVTPRYLDVLRSHRAAHVPVFWTGMPTLREQQRTSGLFTTDFAVLRLMLPPFTRYEDKKAEYAPFNRIVTAQPDMRDDAADLVSLARAAGVQRVFVVVNNKAEGSAPLTIRALVRTLAERASKQNDERPPQSV